MVPRGVGQLAELEAEVPEPPLGADNQQICRGRTLQQRLASRAWRRSQARRSLMWLAEWPSAQHLRDNSPSMSANLVVENHVIYAAA